MNTDAIHARKVAYLSEVIASIQSGDEDPIHIEWLFERVRELEREREALINALIKIRADQNSGLAR